MKQLVVPAVVVLCIAPWAVADEIKSGLQPGEPAGAFNVLDVTGPNQGKSLCYR